MLFVKHQLLARDQGNDSGGILLRQIALECSAALIFEQEQGAVLVVLGIHSVCRLFSYKHWKMRARACMGRF